MSGEQLLDCLNSMKKIGEENRLKNSEIIIGISGLVISGHFCKVGIIKEALRKARFYYMEIYLLLGLTGV